MGTELKIIIADDHQIVRMGLASIFGKESDISVIGEARNGIEAVSLAKELKPDIILMDLMMPKKNGVQATLEILAENPDAKILILTTFGTADEVRQALDAGASGVIVKDTLHEQLIAAIRNTAAGEPERGYRRIGYLIEKPKLRFEQIQADGRGDGFGA